MRCIISIKKKYVDEIFLGNKRYEFRKTYIRKVSRFLVYESGAEGSRVIVGSFEYNEPIVDTPQKIWNMCKEFAGMSEKEFFEYYLNKTVAYAYPITGLSKTLINPYKDIPNFKPPQSYRFW